MTAKLHVACFIAAVIYSVSPKNPPEVLWQFFQNSWEFYDQILLAYYALLSTLEYKILFNYMYLQL